MQLRWLIKAAEQRIMQESLADKMRQLSVRRAAIHSRDIIRPRHTSKNFAPFTAVSLPAERQSLVLFLDIISRGKTRKMHITRAYHSRQTSLFSWHLRFHSTHANAFKLVTKTVKKRYKKRNSKQCPRSAMWRLASIYSNVVRKIRITRKSEQHYHHFKIKSECLKHIYPCLTLLLV